MSWAPDTHRKLQVTRKQGMRMRLKDNARVQAAEARSWPAHGDEEINVECRVISRMIGVESVMVVRVTEVTEAVWRNGKETRG